MPTLFQVGGQLYLLYWEKHVAYLSYTLKVGKLLKNFTWCERLGISNSFSF